MNTLELARPKVTDDLLVRLEVEDFLYYEAQLLDAWKLPEWAALFTDTARYEVASLSAEDPWEADPATSIFLISDHRDQITHRAERLMKKTAHCEFPHSKTRHIISNVRTKIAGKHILAEANYIAYRTKTGKTSRYMGAVRYVLQRMGDSFQIQHKRCSLDLETLNDQGRMTIIL